MINIIIGCWLLLILLFFVVIALVIICLFFVIFTLILINFYLDSNYYFSNCVYFLLSEEPQLSLHLLIL